VKPEETAAEAFLLKRAEDREAVELLDDEEVKAAEEEV
jgi:hypothetical protein